MKWCVSFSSVVLLHSLMKFCAASPSCFHATKQMRVPCFPTRVHETTTMPNFPDVFHAYRLLQIREEPESLLATIYRPAHRHEDLSIFS
jgi:hypothetical protein